MSGWKADGRNVDCDLRDTTYSARGRRCNPITLGLEVERDDVRTAFEELA